MDSNAAANVQGMYFYNEPRLTFDFTSLGVPGLSAYLWSRIATITTATKYTSAAPWHDTWLTPAVGYKFPFGLYAELACRLGNLGADASTDTNDAGLALYFEPQVKISYTMSL